MFGLRQRGPGRTCLWNVQLSPLCPYGKSTVRLEWFPATESIRVEAAWAVISNAAA